MRPAGGLDSAGDNRAGVDFAEAHSEKFKKAHLRAAGECLDVEADEVGKEGDEDEAEEDEDDRADDQDPGDAGVLVISEKV